MQKKILFAAAPLLACVLFLNSCFSVPSLGVGGFNPLSGLQQQASNRVSAEIASASGLTGMTNKVMFNVVYSQVFYMGGFGANIYQLEESQGTVWQIISTDENNNSSKVETERAFLKQMPNGDQWWYLAWRQDGETYEYEALMSNSLQAKKIRYYNADVQRVEEAVFKETASASGNEDTDPPPEAASSDLSKEDLSIYSKGTETVKTNSGTYTAERLEWSNTDSENVTTTYTWWVDQKAPGGLVKYQWTKSGSKESIGGELYAVKKGYTTKFGSF
ncbi:MAG: hypothetical protein FWD78_08355 [Treponema sp.]|nr:hypothetical protein [Treponema sp.]